MRNTGARNRGKESRDGRDTLSSGKLRSQCGG
jgi:hypothetical protein